MFIDDGKARACVPLPKENALQHKGYMAIARKLACAHCGRHGPNQFCHSDEGKGAGIKTDCRRGWPGCAACHVLIGSTGKFPKAERRALEDRYAAGTRQMILCAGLWPKRLPMWPGHVWPSPPRETLA